MPHPSFWADRDVQACVNAKHLYIGDDFSNSHDWRIRGVEDSAVAKAIEWIQAGMVTRPLHIVPIRLRPVIGQAFMEVA